ncbi:neurochondrin-like [Dorcoceras hygrometricum]|uniref:Neurochondrin-like n=1 Tax=Dorcoceras hygrometricum TaxID=472368 RepID=A0A2Z7DIP9_9LAMI|nr:neurochondrin-like [Dorcoceras hygrometricum]
MNCFWPSDNPLLQCPATEVPIDLFGSVCLHLLAGSMEHQASISKFQSDSSAKPSSPSLEDITKLLRGQTDSQRMAGLFLVTKFCNSGDHQHTILEIYRSLDPTFLHRLLLTGMGKGPIAAGRDDAYRDTYLRLSVTVLSAFARAPQIAATQQMRAEVPLFLEILSEGSNLSILEECYEFLLLVSTAHEDGAITLFKSGGMTVLASQMPNLQDGSHAMELAMRLVQLLISKLPGETVYVEHPHELSKMVTTIAMQFAVLHNALKFEALHLLSNILSSKYSVALHVVLQSMVVDKWSTYLRVGVVAVLQNRVAPEEKLQALVLAESVISIIGEDWLIGPITLPGENNSSRTDLCILLVLESSRVEIAVLLNELAYLKYEADKNSSTSAETFMVKLRNLGVAFALVERIIKLVAKFGESEEGVNQLTYVRLCYVHGQHIVPYRTAQCCKWQGCQLTNLKWNFLSESNSNSVITEGTFSKILGGLDETIGVVLDYLQDAKEHGHKKGDDLLASVRVVGSYLAEAPDACRDKVRQLLGYMLSVEGNDEPNSSYSICFLLPMLCQITMRSDGCEMVASTGAFRLVIGHLIALIDSSSCEIEDSGTIFLACDTIMNFLLKRKELQWSLDDPSYVELLLALSHWTEIITHPSATVMASTICALILDSTSEEALLQHPNFNIDNLTSLSLLLKRSLATSVSDLMVGNNNSEADLHQIIALCYSSWEDRFPRIKGVVER